MPRGDGTLTDSERREQLRPHFDAFWKAYPRKVAINDAERAFVAACTGTKTREGKDPTWLVEKARAYAQNTNPDDLKYAPYPAKWLADGHYEDSDLFTDQFEAEREYLRACYKRCDVTGVEKRYGVTYPYKAIPDDITELEDIKRWHKAQVRLWITEVESKVLSDN